MPHVTDMSYVHKRFEHFSRRLEQTLTALAYPASEVERQTKLLRTRLLAHDYHLPLDTPVRHLQSGRNVARFFMRSAVQFCPAERARVNRLRQNYADKCKRIREESPHACFFSFEGACAGMIRPDWKRFHSLLKL